MKSKIITIDGPAASGKTTVSRELGKKLSWRWVSTGAFYRGLGYVAKEEECNLEDAKALAELASSDVWEVRLSDDNTLVFYKGEDVTKSIFLEEVGNIASKISPYPEVRAALLDAQRALADGSGLVAEGRDCGTVVFPNADLKLYITANSADRAKRRAIEQGESVESIAQEQKKRDHQDQSRTVAPLQVPEGARVIDTSEMDLNQTIESILNIVVEELDLL